MKDNRVDHPKHYNSHPSGVECIEIIRHFPFNIGAAMKYLWRHGLKPEAGIDNIDKLIEDLEKAAWHCKDEAERWRKTKRETLEMKKKYE